MKAACDDDEEVSSLMGRSAFARPGPSRPVGGDSEPWSRRLIRSLKALSQRHQSVFHTALIVFIVSGLLMVVVWDLKQVHQMSEVIHDDHSSLWETVNETTLKQWLTPMDLCLLKSTESTAADLKKVVASNCSKVASYGSTASPHRLFCSIGASLGKQCPPPLARHSFFSQRIRDSSLHDPTARQLSKAMRALARRHMPLIFIGDGLSKQNEDAVVCDLLRTDRVSIAAVMNTNYHEIVSDYVVRWRDEPLRLDVKYFPLDYIEEDGGEHVANLFRKKRKKRRRALPVVSAANQSVAGRGQAVGSGGAKKAPAGKKAPGKPPAPGERTRDDGRSNITFYDDASPLRSGSLIDYQLIGGANRTGVTSPTSDMDNSNTTHAHGLQVIQEVIAALLARNHSVAIIANAGVWYNSRERFRKELPDFLGWLDALAADPRNVVLYRETAAQHWNHTSYGYFDEDYRIEQEQAGTCVPIADSTPVLDWRNSDVRHAIENEGLRHLRMIPFHKYTMPLHNMHPTTSEAEDCTHYCYFPQMWQPVWRALFNATTALSPGLA